MSCPRSFALKRYPLYRAMKYKDDHKYIPAIGCSAGEFRHHIERQFRDGMQWENYGAWTFQHIYPAAYLERADDDKSSKYNHWSNLRPIWHEEINRVPEEPDHYADYNTMRNVSPYNTIINEHGIAELIAGA